MSKAKASFTVSATFKKQVMDAQAGLGDIEPIAVNLYKQFEVACGADSKFGLSQLAFYRLFDPSIPEEYGKPGSDERKALDTHKAYNRMRRMVSMGRKIENGGKRKISATDRVKKMDANAATLARWMKAYKISYAAVQALFKLEITGIKKNDKFTDKVLAAAGFDKAKAAVEAMKQAAA